MYKMYMHACSICTYVCKLFIVPWILNDCLCTCAYAYVYMGLHICVVIVILILTITTETDQNTELNDTIGPINFTVCK